MGEWQHPSHYTPQACLYARAVRKAEIAIFIEHALPLLREAARVHEYTLAIHGSCERDLDLIAVPWSDDSGDADTLIKSLAEATARATGWGHLNDRGRREQKPHGRFAITILASADVHLDISIMSLQTAKENTNG